MNTLSIIFGLLVGMINIMLNIKIQDAAQNANATTFIDAVLSIKFLIAFGVGTLSITMLMLFYFYASKFNLAQSLILMGSSSIVFGTLFGIIFRNNVISFVEIVALIAIVSSYSYKFIYRT